MGVYSVSTDLDIKSFPTKVESDLVRSGKLGNLRMQFRSRYPLFSCFCTKSENFFLQKYSSRCKKFLHFFIFWIFVLKTWYLNELRTKKSPKSTILKKLIWHRFFTENGKIFLYTLFSSARNRLETFLGPLFHVKTLYFKEKYIVIIFLNSNSCQFQLNFH